MRNAYILEYFLIFQKCMDFKHLACYITIFLKHHEQQIIDIVLCRYYFNRHIQKVLFIGIKIHKMFSKL